MMMTRAVSDAKIPKSVLEVTRNSSMILMPCTSRERHQVVNSPHNVKMCRRNLQCALSDSGVLSSHIQNLGGRQSL